MSTSAVFSAENALRAQRATARTQLGAFSAARESLLDATSATPSPEGLVDAYIATRETLRAQLAAVAGQARAASRLLRELA